MPSLSNGELLLTELDRARLLKLDEGALPPPMLTLLNDASTLPSRSIPPHVVTMYSQVLVCHEGSDVPQKLTLCYPSDAEPAAGFISVLSPVGIALLGRAVGSTVAWVSPDGRLRRLRIEALLFQPETSGDYSI